MRSLEDVVASYDRERKAKLEFRRSIGWFTRGELARLSRFDGPGLDELETAVRRAVAESGA
ncbi:MAG: hypothetical protein ACT4P7_05050 [Gemmatimonadaceae bacterium]